jgi:hypothetical protein
MSLPPSMRQKLIEEQPNSGNWSPDLKTLLDPKIEARPLQLPNVGQIGIKNTEYDYYWARLRRGANPDVTRYLQLKAAGYTKATREDVDPLVNSVNVSDDGEEITCGIDLILMKAHPSVHRGAMKFHQERALNMTNPKGREAQEAMMRSGSYSQDDRALRASNTQSTDDSGRADASAEGAVRMGTDKWDKTLKAKKE